MVARMARFRVPVAWTWSRATVAREGEDPGSPLYTLDLASTVDAHEKIVIEIFDDEHAPDLANDEIAFAPGHGLEAGAELLSVERLEANLPEPSAEVRARKLDRERVAARWNLANAIARRIEPFVPECGIKDDLPDWLDHSIMWVFEDAVERGFPLDETLTFATEKILDNLQMEVGEESREPWPPSVRGSPPMNRDGWATLSSREIHFGYGSAADGTLTLEPISFDELRENPWPAKLEELP